MVISARSPSSRDVEHLAQAARRISEDRDLEICCSVGILSRQQAQGPRVSDCGVSVLALIFELSDTLETLDL